MTRTFGPVEVHGEWFDFQKGCGLRLTLPGRWFRVAVFYGTPPGSHMGFWRTRVDTLRGWNYRVGTIRRCATVLLHTRAA
jgi:hypothetical protein